MVKTRKRVNVGNQEVQRRYIGNKLIFENLGDKTGPLSGVEIFTDKADDSVVHVEIDGVISGLNDFDVVSSVSRENLIPSRALRPSQATTTEEFTLNIWGSELINAQDTAKMLEAGETYTFSYEAELIERTTVPTVHILQAGMLLYSQTGSTPSFYSGVRELGDKSKVSVTFVCPPLNSDHRFLIYTNRYINGGSPAGYDTIKFKNLKLEKGSNSTPYSPAPEDINENDNHPLIDKINLSLSEPLRNVGDVKDRLFRDNDGLWKVERNVHISGVEILSQEMQDKLNNLRSFQDSNYVYTALNNTDISPTLHATFKSKGWYDYYLKTLLK